MSVYKRIGGFDVSAKNKAKMANEGADGKARMWLKRQAQQKKPKSSVKERSNA